MTLFLTVLQPTARVTLQHPMFAAEMSVAEPAVADYPLRLLLAVFETAAWLLWGSHAATHRAEEVEGGVVEDLGGGDRGF